MLKGPEAGCGSSEATQHNAHMLRQEPLGTAWVAVARKATHKTRHVPVSDVPYSTTCDWQRTTRNKAAPAGFAENRFALRGSAAHERANARCVWNAAGKGHVPMNRSL